MTPEVSLTVLKTYNPLKVLKNNCIITLLRLNRRQPYPKYLHPIKALSKITNTDTPPTITPIKTPKMY